MWVMDGVERGGTRTDRQDLWRGTAVGTSVGLLLFAALVTLLVVLRATVHGFEKSNVEVALLVGVAIVANIVPGYAAARATARRDAELALKAAGLSGAVLGVVSSIFAAATHHVFELRNTHSSASDVLGLAASGAAFAMVGAAIWFHRAARRASTGSGT